MKVLLHVCCAPCSTVAIERLAEAGHSVTVFFCNPNIYPHDERAHREAEAAVLSSGLGLESVIDQGDPAGWRKAIEPLAPRGEKSQRCWACYAWRLDATAREARRLGLDAFTTTLTTAPMKDTKVIARIGRMLGRKHRVSYLAEDFKKKDGFHRSAVLSREHGLYRQDYCGCEWSLRESEERKNNRLKA
jgi:predicted adenine nucleotide alpha hydrolase (AANH) superfamily ATPase